MRSTEKLKELAIRQMRAAAGLYDICEAAEIGFDKGNDDYNKYFLQVQRDFRTEVLKIKFGLEVSKEEQALWEEVLHS